MEQKIRKVYGMKLIFCIDDKSGMMFFGKRQSQDQNRRFGKGIGGTAPVFLPHNGNKGNHQQKYSPKNKLFDEMIYMASLPF